MKSHDERMHELLYSCDGRVEICEHICKLEDLARAFWRWTHARCHKCDRWVQLSKGVGTCRDSECKYYQAVLDLIEETGVEVPYA